MNTSGQAFIFGAVALLLGIMAIIVYALLAPVMSEFIDMGVNASVEHGDNATPFFIKLIPIWVIVLIVGSVAWMIFSGGGDA